MRLTHSVLELSRTKDLWHRLLSGLEAPSFYHRREWHQALTAHLVPDVDFHWFFDGGEPVAVFPFSVTRSAASMIRELRLPHHRELFLRDCLIADAYVHVDWPSTLAASALDPGGGGPHALRFHRVAGSSCAVRAFEAGSPGVRRSPSVGRAYFDVSSVGSLESLSSKHLRNVDRLRRKAEREHGAAAVESLVGGEAASRGIDLFSAVEASGWKGPDGTRTSLSCRPRLDRFYRALATSFARTDDVRVDVLTIAGGEAAAQVALRTARAWHILKVGYDETFSAYGPGNILLKAFVEEAAEDPSVDEVGLVTNPDWAVRWHVRREPSFDISLFPRTVAGRIRMLRHDAIGLVRRLAGVASEPSERGAGPA